MSWALIRKRLATWAAWLTNWWLSVRVSFEIPADEVVEYMKRRRLGMAAGPWLLWRWTCRKRARSGTVQVVEYWMHHGADDWRKDLHP